MTFVSMALDAARYVYAVAMGHTVDIDRQDGYTTVVERDARIIPLFYLYNQ